ncbi:PepSY domain-containing protein [Dyella halodurans]|uniref:PepSY domain-containing protein n=1 Tax=Dyella halodurans TaxID=1920171 RepID=A0ABV9C344_9GAMM|nr:PepSY domain-containing protein [Dyella halodurans]
MVKRMLPLVIGLSICGIASAQHLPATAQSASSATETTQTTTTVTTWTSKPPMGALTEDAIKTAIANAGYKEVKGLEFKDGVWRTEARGGNKQWAKLAVGPINGRIYPADGPSKLNKNEVSAQLTSAGFQDIKHVKFEDGLWNAEARSTRGGDVNLKVDPNDGSVVARSHD